MLVLHVGHVAIYEIPSYLLIFAFLYTTTYRNTGRNNKHDMNIENTQLIENIF